MSRDRAVDANVAEALARLRRESTVPWDRMTPPLRITLAVSGSTRDVAHGLGAIPDGMLVVWADAPIFAVPGVPWTRDLAFLRASSNNVHAIVCFYTLKETPTNA